MVREILTINIGQCGVQMGHTIWKQYCSEHNIDVDGTKSEKEEKESTDTTFQAFFQERGKGEYVARTLMVDLQPDTIDAVKTSKHRKLFDENYLLCGKEDASKNFARGHYTVGKEIIDKVSDRLRATLDNCENVAGFVINHSVGGGTGSGLGCLILERLAVHYRKKSKLGFEVYPSPIISNCVMEPYNALLASSWLLDHTEVSVVLDNEAIYEICQKRLAQQRPSFECMNQLIAKLVSSTTAPLRFDGIAMNTDINEYQTNLVPFPRLHLMIGSMLPITTKQQLHKTYTDVHSITELCFSSSQFFTKIDEFDLSEDKYMAMCVMYHGDVSVKEAEAAMHWMTTNGGVTFVEWCPTAERRTGYHKQPIAALKGDDDVVAECERNIGVIANNTCMGRFMSERICKIFDKMYSQRAYVYCYVGEGMEEGEFLEAREDLGFLEKDYLDVLSEAETDNS